MNKRKIINDPVHGFITIPGEIIFDLIEHKYVQRLRRIKQLGLTNLVYPGALHTRFHHAIGAMHLMGEAIEVLRFKDIAISAEEAEAATIAILLHDIGHGPFSHALEKSIVHGITHEDISGLFMEELNQEFQGRLSLAITIFRDQYPKKFLHQLVSSQLDIDRLDYLMRDSFFTGVSEGVVSSDRIIKMMNVVNNQLVIEAKGIYSIEKFILARRLMYWQVYLHKTVISAENTLVNILRRANELAVQKVDLFCTPALREFLYGNYSKADFISKEHLLKTFAELDDNDVMASIKVWTRHPDPVLVRLCENLMNRRLLRIEMQNQPFEEGFISGLRKSVQAKYNITEQQSTYFVFSGMVANDAYRTDKIRINILMKDGKVSDIAEASDQLDMEVLTRTVSKHYLCFPKELA